MLRSPEHLPTETTLPDMVAKALNRREEWADRLAVPLQGTSEKPAFTVRCLMIATAFIGIFTVATGVAVDSDTWWHLSAGKWMLEHGQILTHDVFSGTMHGRPWIDHAWLSQIPMFLIWDRFGFAGLNLATAALVTLAFLFVYLQCRGSVYLKAFVLILGLASSALYWPARPQIVSFALASVFAWILHLYRWRGIDRLWLLPPLMFVWVNLHAGFVIGFILIAVTLAGQAGSKAFGQRGEGIVDWPGIARLALIGLVCTAVVPLNPYGVQTFTYAFHTVSISVLRDFIQEWMSPNFHWLETQMFIWLLLATLAAVGTSRRGIDLTDLLLVSVFAYLALLAVRNIALFALVAPPVLTRHAAAGLDELGKRHPRWHAAIATGAEVGPPRQALNVVLLALIILAAVVKVSVPLRPSTNVAVLGRYLPIAATEYIRRSHPPGPMFNSYGWGGYLAWALSPDYRVYVDGRTDLYGDKFLREYLRVEAGRDEWRKVFARERVRLVVIARESVLADVLRREPLWREAYSDEVAAVFVRGASGRPPSRDSTLP